MKIKVYHNIITEMEVDDKFTDLVDSNADVDVDTCVALSKELIDTIANELNTTYSNIVYVEDMATEYPLYED